LLPPALPAAAGASGRLGVHRPENGQPITRQSYQAQPQIIACHVQHPHQNAVPARVLIAVIS
jgi:hypothetical protein